VPESFRVLGCVKMVFFESPLAGAAVKDPGAPRDIWILAEIDSKGIREVSIELEVKRVGWRIS